MATDSQHWEFWVGDQTPKEFMSYCEGQTPEQATVEYVEWLRLDHAFAPGCPIPADNLAEILARYIRRCGY